MCQECKVRGRCEAESPNEKSFNTGKVAGGKSCAILSVRATRKEEKRFDIVGTVYHLVIYMQSYNFLTPGRVE